MKLLSIPHNQMVGSDRESKPKKKRKRTTPHSGAEEKELFESRSKHEGSRGVAYRKWSKQARDIAPLPLGTINWERRNRCRLNLRLFLKTYLPATFYDPWSLDQTEVADTIQKVSLEGGLYAIAMPRGGGKTAICQGGMVWLSAYGHRRYLYFIGDKEDSAKESLLSIRTEWETNDLLISDFPELAYPIQCTEGRAHSQTGQLYRGMKTRINWGTTEIHFPCITLLPEEIFSENDYIPLPNNLFTHKGCGSVIKTEGITGGIRGATHKHPLTGELLRPDLFLADDIQSDRAADSPSTVTKIIRQVESAIECLSGPGRLISGIMPCTVTRPGDVSDTFLSPEKKPEWKGKRCSMVVQWPEGIDEDQISLETSQGKQWNKYAELRIQSLRERQDISLATEYYAKHQRVMDQDFKVSWESRYNKDPNVKGNRELSAIQHAMNIRLHKPFVFASEFQNKPRTQTGGGTHLITASQLAEKVIPSLERNPLQSREGNLPVGVEYVTAFIDLQEEILFYSVLACEPDFTGYIIDYGTWPSIDKLYFYKSETEKWLLLSRKYFEAYPNERPEKYKKKGGGAKARLEGRIYYALECLSSLFLSREYVREDGSILYLSKLGIDARWGQATKTVKRFVREIRNNKIIPCHGQYVGASSKPFDAWHRKKGWLFGDHWIYPPPQEGSRHLLVDVNFYKSFLFNRLATPLGNPSCIALFNAPPEFHTLYASHVAESEEPDTIQSKKHGRKVDEWHLRDGRPDNEWLDTTVGCLALASFAGAKIEVKIRESQHSESTPTKPRSLSQKWREKRGQG